jgi:hypothetical protein
MELLGNYTLDVRVGDNVIPVSPQMIQELTITQDIDRLVPTFNFRISDATGLLGEVVPFDKESNQISLRFSRFQTSNSLNEFQFLVKRRRPLGDKSYAIEGVLDVPNLFSPKKTRTLIGNIKGNLEDIAIDELGVAGTEIGESLNYDKTILQPSWTNGFLLRYLRDRLVGTGNTGCFFCFIKNVESDKVLVFKSIDELYLADVGSNKFIIGAQPYEDFMPVSEYRIYDNSALLTSLLGRTETYNYFNYETGEYKQGSINLADCPSLSDFYLIDSDNDTAIESIRSMGCGNAFTSDFIGEVRNKFYKHATGFIHMWISSWGVENLSPGELVQVHFADAFRQGNLSIFQHSGLWMVKRVVHILSNSFMSNILLTRCGIDTDMNTTLLPALQARKL